MIVDVTTWFLEMRDPAQLRPGRCDNPRLTVTQAEIPSPELSRFLYTSVGGSWYWCDRLSWSYDSWMAYLDRAEVQTWVAYLAGTPAGYIELEAKPDCTVEIAYFGLLKPFIGQGIGGYLLTRGIQQAWAMGAQRVWVHTCSLDGPHALANYQARGLQIYQELTLPQDLPDRPMGPWEGAYES